MASRNTLILRMRDPMDQWLESQGLYRKLIAKDGSCLFRAVSEQVFHTQVLHTKVRMACVNFMKKHEDLFLECGEESLNERILSMQNPWEWGGKLEMRVMSFMYRRDFLVYQELSMPPVKATCNGFKEKIVLCQLGNNQYDSVYPKQYVDNAGFCQSIVYHILYDRVFNMEGTDYAVDKMLHDKSVRLRRDSYITQCSTCTTVRKQNLNKMNGAVDKFYGERIDEGHFESKLSKEWYNSAKEILLQGIIPFPYKVAKALDPEIYRNIEFDVWNEQRKELKWGVCDLLNGGESRELRVGSKCLVRLDSSPGKELHAHIQEMALEKGPVLVYVEELAKKVIVQFDTLKPLQSGYPPHSLMRSDRGKNYVISERKYFSNACHQNAVTITSTSKHCGIQTWRQSYGKNRMNYGRYENKSNGGSCKDGGRAKNIANKTKGRSITGQHVGVPVGTSPVSRAMCQQVTLNQEERYSQVLFTNPQLHVNQQAQQSESSINVTSQVTPMLGPQNNIILPNTPKQTPLKTSCSTSTASESICTVPPMGASPCECPSCWEKVNGQPCNLVPSIETERFPYNAPPMCYCCYSVVDWRPGPNGSNHSVPSLVSSCGGPIIQAPPVYPCSSLSSEICLTPPPDSFEGRNLPLPEMPGYRVYNMGHDYYRPGYMAWPGSNIYTGHQHEIEGGGHSQDDEKHPQQVTCTTIDAPTSQNECSTMAPSILSPTSRQDSAFTGQIGRSEQDFTSLSKEEKPSYDQSMNQLKYPSSTQVQMTSDHGLLTGERARDELPFPSTQGSCSLPAEQQEVETILPQNVGRWVDTVRHIPPPVNGSMIHPMPPSFMPMQSQSLSPAMYPYPSPHGGIETPFYMCTATSSHTSGHHLVYSPFPTPHPLPHPQTHILPAPLHPRFFYPNTHANSSVAPLQ